MSGYLRPVDAPVSCSWQCHLDRSPPSSEPGTDYASAYGTPVLAANPGTVIDRQTSPSGATGRYVTVRLDDGRTTRDLHLAEVHVDVGRRVLRGDVLGLSGASGNGSDNYYGPHVHRTLWPGEIWAAPTIDFERYVGGTTPPPDEDEEGITMRGAYYTRDDGVIEYMLFNEYSGFHVQHTGADGAYNNAIAASWETNSWAKITASHAKYLRAALDETAARAAAASRSRWAGRDRPRARRRRRARGRAARVKLQFDDDGDGWVLLAIVVVIVVGSVVVAWLT